MSPRTGPDDLETREISCPVGILTPDRTALSMVTIFTALLRFALWRVTKSCGGDLNCVVEFRPLWLAAISMIECLVSGASKHSDSFWQKLWIENYSTDWNLINLYSKDFFIRNNHSAAPSTLSLWRPFSFTPLPTDTPLGAQSVYIDSKVCIDNFYQQLGKAAVWREACTIWITVSMRINY